MKAFYITLVRELTGYCVVAYASSENIVREYAANTYGKLWCSVYPEERKPGERIIGNIAYLD